ncbi:hypothetical protein D5086_014250 [Populus alba]|uniref:Uncharacterized protein n=1 Tax=Populus alba TaxID=43335 RepID=A0ACC4BXF0_POPAL
MEVIETIDVVFTVDFIVDGDANGDEPGNAVVDVARAGDENEIFENSAEEEFEQYEDRKMDKETLDIDTITDGAPAMSMITADEPYLGQEFDSEAAAHAFYNAYATRIGFVIRNEHDKIRELSQQLAIEKKRSATYKRHLELIFEHIEEHNESLSKKIQHIVDSVRDMENKEQQSQT